ncbi:pupal cuticle protein C1B-like [Hylaeus anthracinus]|uniref:pupal cuticle protein C1B-like n=1 Tax=Hylaeus anthracinus TaxID=313031 RepID=UPI0023B99E38|nr:pupal cuticle protein C1B-like [Hylaeus anthracinus]XP_053998569.1 pupal cuticle protein C1B-like [Hylaeus anthracinus]
MFIKIMILACTLAVSNAGTLAPYAGQYTLTTGALTSTSDNILRSSGNLAQIATQSKTIATPFSTSSKSDIRVTNPAIYAQYAHAAPVAYAAHAAPVAYAAQAAPLAYAAHAAPLAAPIAHSNQLLGVAYSPAVAVSHMAYSSPIGVSYSW